MLERVREPRSTTAAAVSSQELSMASMRPLPAGLPFGAGSSESVTLL